VTQSYWLPGFPGRTCESPHRGNLFASHEFGLAFHPGANFKKPIGKVSRACGRAGDKPIVLDAPQLRPLKKIRGAMKSALTIALVLSLSLNVIVSVMFFSARQQQSQLNMKLTQSLQAVTNAQAIAEIKDGTIALLQEKVVKLTDALTNSTAQLAAAEQTIQALVSAQEEMLKQQKSVQKVPAEIPPPTITIEKDKNGIETKKFFFPQVADRNAHVVARDAEFGGVYGRRLLFRSPAGPITLDVEWVHPAILQHLNIKAEQIIERHTRAELAWRAHWEAQRKAALERWEAERRIELEKRETEERLRLERAKTAAEIAKLNAEEQAKREYAWNERVKAEAAARLADAAMLNALNRPVINYYYPVWH
jgi:hypothetical protein